MPRDAALRHKHIAKRVTDSMAGTSASSIMASDAIIQRTPSTRPPSPVPIRPQLRGGPHPESAQHSQLTEQPYHDSTITGKSEKIGEVGGITAEVDATDEVSAPAPVSTFSSRYLFIDEQGHIEDEGMSEGVADRVSGVDSQPGP